ncbi:hypothetical protein [Thermoleptolyngbya sp.]
MIYDAESLRDSNWRGDRPRHVWFCAWDGLAGGAGVYGKGIINRISDDAIWPIAIFMTWLWPISIPVGWLVGWGLLGHSPKATKTLATAAVMVLWGLGLTLYFVWIAPKKETP